MGWIRLAQDLVARFCEQTSKSSSYVKGEDLFHTERLSVFQEVAC
jgi:hypothetical protein